MSRSAYRSLPSRHAQVVETLPGVHSLHWLASLPCRSRQSARLPRLCPYQRSKMICDVQLELPPLAQNIFARDLTSGRLCKQRAYLLPRFMDNRHHHVRWPFMSELRNPFTKVGLNSLDTTGFQVVIQLCLFAHHRFRFDNEIDTLARAQFINIPVCLLRRTGLVHDGSRCLRHSPKLRQQLGLMLNSIIFRLAQQRAHVRKTIIWAILVLFIAKDGLA